MVKLAHIILFGIFLCTWSFVFGQTPIVEKDVMDFVRKTSPNNESLGIVVDKNYFSLLPFIGYSPATGGLLGAALSISRQLAPNPTKLSSAMLNASITSKQQVIMNARSKVYLNRNKWFLQGDWRMLFFAQPTYGLGIQPIDGNKFLFSLNGMNNIEYATSQQDMRFNYIRIYEDAVKEIDKHWYTGLGFAFEHHFNIQDQRLQLDSTLPNPFLTSHYLYSQALGYNQKRYTTSGLNVNFLTDTRDNIINAQNGYLISFTYRINSTILGSTQNSSMLSYDGRYFIPFILNNKKHVLAFWSLGQFLVSGNLPYLALPSIGWDTYNRSGRGYVQGRYRGLSMVYNEIEFRYQLSKSGMWGLVAFLNGTFAESTQQKLFYKMAPAGGLGLRMKMDKRARVNLTVDIAYGTENSSGLYFNLQEAF